MNKAEAKKILQKYIAKWTTKKYGAFSALPEVKDAILEAMGEYANEVSREESVKLLLYVVGNLFMADKTDDEKNVWANKWFDDWKSNQEDK